MSAFVQISLEVWEARRQRVLTGAEWDLAVYIAFETDFRTGRLTRTLSAIADDLGWTSPKVPSTTMSRRLAKLREFGFVEYESAQGQRLPYVIRPTPKLLRTGRLARNFPIFSDGDGEVHRAHGEVGGEVEPSLSQGFELPGEEVGEEVPREEVKRQPLLLHQPHITALDRGEGETANGRVQGTGNGKSSSYIPNLNSYTGCREVRGETGIGHKYDPLGTARPPVDWPYERPSRHQIGKALAARGVPA